MSSADFVAGELGADNPVAITADPGRTDWSHPNLTLRQAITRMLFESTLWSAVPSGDDLRAKTPSLDTVHGHARDACGWARDNNAKLDAILANQAEILAQLKGTK